jgi:hypothetical protein
MRRDIRRALHVLAVAGTIGVGLPEQTQAATTIGSDLSGAPGGTTGCASTCTFVSRAIPGLTVAAPSDGVIVKWRVRTLATGSAAPTPATLRVVRGTGVNSTGIRSDAPVSIPSTPGTYSFDARLPVSAGDYLGYDSPRGWFAGKAGASYDLWDPALGNAETRFRTTGFAGLELLFNADLEADADKDGFGDETQDGCPTQAHTQGACDTDPPETTITETPPNVTEKRRVEYGFDSDEASSTFECKKDRKPWRPCSSPFEWRRLTQGRHRFRVRAVDIAGNADPTPAEDRFRVVQAPGTGRSEARP